MAKWGDSPWMYNYLIIEIGRAYELGFTKSEGLLKYVCHYLGGMLTDPAYNPYLIMEYRIPTIRKHPTNDSILEWFDTWAEVKACYPPDKQSMSEWGGWSDAEHDYRYIAMAAVAQCYNQPNGPAAWNFMSPLLSQVKLPLPCCLHITAST